MATTHGIAQLYTAIEELSSVDMERLGRSNLGEESLATKLSSREAEIERIKRLARNYSILVHDDTLGEIVTNFQSITNAMNDQAQPDSSSYLRNTDQFLKLLDAHIEEANRWKPIVASAAMLERGLLDDEDCKIQSDRARNNIRREADEMLEALQTKADNILEGAKKLAGGIESKARLSTAHQ